MDNLKTEYTDIKNIKHKVEHLTVPNKEDSRERIIEELLHALTRPVKHIPKQ